MLNQFRTRYPQGCLLSELIAIEHGQYIVKVLVQVEGITLATGLAAASNVEQAEDTARIRALVTLNLDSTEIAFSQNHLKEESYQQSTPETITLSSAENSKIQPNLKESNDQSEFLAEINQPVSSTAIESSSNGAKKVETKSKTVSATRSDNHTQKEVVPESNTVTSPPSIPESPTLSSGVTESLNPQPISSSSSTVPKTPKMSKTPKEKPQPVGLEETTEPTQPEVLPLVESTPEIEIPKASELLDETPLIPSQPDEVTEVTAPLISPIETSSPPVETLDFSDIMARSNAQLKRLGWTTEKGRDYLLQTYGKKSRHLLNDQELLEFLNYLESLPTP